MFQSTQPQNPTRCTLKEALLGPLPDPHHLWTPSTLPPLDTLDPQSSLQKLLSKILLSFGFPEKLCQDPLGFDPVRLVGDQFQLWHGPTESFKDLGCDACIRLYRQWFPEKTVVVATSGDTGGGWRPPASATATVASCCTPKVASPPTKPPKWSVASLWWPWRSRATLTAANLGQRDAGHGQLPLVQQHFAGADPAPGRVLRMAEPAPPRRRHHRPIR